MLNKRLLGVMAVSTALALSPLVLAQPRPDSASLPIKQIVLFSSGVGYFQREGEIEGNKRVDLQFRMEDINDLLKSLVLEDSAGGQIATVNYDNRAPVEHTLKSFAIDLRSNPSMADLLNQVRGQEIEVLTTVDINPAAAVVGQAEKIVGTIVGVEKKMRAVSKDQAVQIAQLNMLTKDGLRGVPLSQVQRVRFLNTELDQEFRKALAVLATAHDSQRKTVSLNFMGTGTRKVKVGYITESPMWKTSYRLSIKKDGVFLQGWAIVENTTDEDWTNVQLGLVSGRPISFQMNMYDPLFVPRPVVEPELFASLRPQVYEGNMYADRAVEELEKAARRGYAPGGKAQAEGKGFGGRAADAQRALNLLQKKRKDALDFTGNMQTISATSDLGEYFEYLIRQPISLPRQKSALLPIISDPVKGQKVSIFNESVHAKFPLRGLQFTNDTPFHLNQGPITVFENGTYAGDARIGHLQPGETRLLSYAIDLGTEVEPKRTEANDLLKVKIVRGIVHQEFRHREIKTYRVLNRSDETKTVLIEHPYRSHLTLVTPKKAKERTRNVYRFEVKAEPNDPVDLVVEEHQPRTTTIRLSNSDSNTVQMLLRTDEASAEVKKALQRALGMKTKIDELRRDLAREQEELSEIEREQARMRENMKVLPQTAEIYKVYLKKFLAQESEIAKRRDKISELREAVDAESRGYERFLANLNVE
ncbi:MAG: hypothetical protein KatS3mg105_1583 [Gemmatales bacterium]|nr:MAG: hypothetical protein KatS3mg105_1583 [Gemmatales bacterium]